MKKLINKFNGAHQQFTMAQIVLILIYNLSYIISNIVFYKFVGSVTLFGELVAISVGTFLYPVVYILSDVFSEVWGYKFSAITRYLCLGCQAFTSIMFMICVALPGNELTQAGLSDAMGMVLGSMPKVVAASLICFAVGDFVNDKIFAFMKNKVPQLGYAARAFVSSIFGAFIDTTILFAFTMPYLFEYGVAQFLIIVASDVGFRLIIEFFTLPISYGLSKWLKKGEAKRCMN